MKKRGTSSYKKRTVSIRQQLPLMVRVHYDAVRNFAPVKAVGMGVMALIGIFGVLLATQTISPSSYADTNANAVTVVQANEGVSVTKNSESATQVSFNVDVSLGNLSDSSSVQYYTANSFRGTCSTSGSFYTRDAVRGTGTNNDLGGPHTVSITDSVKVVCLRVKTFRTVMAPPRPQSKVFYGVYSIAVNRGTSTTTPSTRTQTPTVDIFSLYQLSSNPLRILGFADGDAAWHSKIAGPNDACDSSTSFAAGPNMGEVYSSYSRVFSYDIMDTEFQRNYHNGKQFCVRATARDGTADYRSFIIDLLAQSGTTTTTTTPGVAAPEITVRAFLSTVPPATLPSNIQVTASADQDIAGWDYIVVDNSVFNDYSNTGTINACERLFGLNPARQAQVWLATGSWSSSLAVNSNANGLVGNRGGNANEAVLQLNLSHGGRFVCIKATNENGNDHAGRLLPIAPTTAPEPVVTPVEEPVTPEQPAPRTGTDDETDTTDAAEEVAVEETEEETGVEEDGDPAGGKDDGEGEAISSTGGDNERNWSQLAGYLLIAGAILGIARILIVKKYRQMG